MPVAKLLLDVLPPRFGDSSGRSRNTGAEGNARPQDPDEQGCGANLTDISIADAYRMLLCNPHACTADWLLQHRLRVWMETDDEKAEFDDDSLLRRLVRIVIGHSSLGDLGREDLLQVLGVLELRGTIVEHEAIAHCLSQR